MKNLASTLGKGTLWLVSGDIVVKVTGLLYLFLILSHLAVYEYGLVKLALSVPALLSVFGLAGLHPVMVADLITLKEQKRFSEMSFKLSAFLSAKVVMGIVAAAGLFGSTFLFTHFFSEEILNLVRILSILFLLGPVRSLIVLSLEVSKNFKIRSWFAVFEEIIKLLLVFILLSLLHQGVTGVIVATVAANFLVAAAFLPICLSILRNEITGPILSRGVWSPWSVFRDHAKWSIFFDSLNNFALNIRPWIVQFILGMSAVGIYGIAMALLSPLKSLVPISRVILPILPSYIEKKIVMIKIINSSIKYKLYSQVILSITAIAALPILFIFLPDYQEAQWLFAAMTLAFIPQSFQQMFSVVFHAFKMQKNLFVTTLLNLAAVMLLLPASLLFFGLYGVAVELFITQSLFVYSRYKALKRPLPEYTLPYKDLISITPTDKWLFKKIINKVPYLRGLSQ